MELDFSRDIKVDLSQVDFQRLKQVTVHIPLPSFGVSNSNIDLCADLLDAIWVLERLAGCAERMDTTIGSGYYKPNISVVLHGLGPNIRETLTDCALLIMEESSGMDQADRIAVLRSEVAEYEDTLHTLTPHVPEIVDWYFGNLIYAYGELRDENPEYYADQIARFPERQVSYFKSAYSDLLGGNCYCSTDGWILDTQVDVDEFFKTTGQDYRLEDFLPAQIFALGGGTFAHSEGLLIQFPMRHYLESLVCVGLTKRQDDREYLSSPFCSAVGEFSLVPQTQVDGRPSQVETGPLLSVGCFVHETGTLVFINDGRCRHFLYDSKPLNLGAAKDVREAAADMMERLSSAAGAPVAQRCDWASLTDEKFEELCYDIIYSTPKFDSATIRKLGKSRSRDGGRDIEVCELPILRGARPKKWIFQCKLVTSGSSLGTTKLTDVGDMLDQYNAQGFGVMTSTFIDATLYDRLDGVCGRRKIEQYHFSMLELERTLARHPKLRRHYFP